MNASSPRNKLALGLAQGVGTAGGFAGFDRPSRLLREQLTQSLFNDLIASWEKLARQSREWGVQLGSDQRACESLAAAYLHCARGLRRTMELVAERNSLAATINAAADASAAFDAAADAAESQVRS